MIKIDLITGFLGAGKTTFIKKYASYLIDKGLNIGILENDHGAVNVDMLLLQELRGANCELEMVAGACSDDCFKRRFKTRLISMAMTGVYDRIIVEPSGVFDMDMFFDIVREEPLDRWYEIGNVIAIADATYIVKNVDPDIIYKPGVIHNINDKAETMHNVNDKTSGMSETDRYILASEIANAGMIVVSKNDLQKADDTTIADAFDRLLNSIKCERKLNGHILSRNISDYTNEDYELLLNCGYVRADYVKKSDIRSNYSSVYFLDETFDKSNLEKKINQLFENTDCGEIFRVKGFFSLNGRWYLVNATKDNYFTEEIKVGQEVFIVVGENLNEDEIRKVLLDN